MRFTESIVRRRWTTNSDGDRTLDSELTIPGCVIAPRGSTATATSNEDNDRASGVTTGWAVYAPYGADVIALDTIVLANGEWEVDGDPSPWKSPFTDRRAGLEIRLIRRTG